MFNLLDEFTFRSVLLLLLDIYLVWLILYLVLRVIKLNVRAIQILKGLVFIYIINFVSEFFDLHTLNSLVEIVIQWGLLVVIIIFQPEIRSGLEQIGRNSMLRRSKNNEEQGAVSILCESVSFLAKRRIGALVVIERNVKLDEFVSTATLINSHLSVELLTTIFVPTTPLHDGAVIIRDEKLYCAAAYLPTTTREDMSKAFGTRHRAAMGVSEVSDSITLVVSEETGRFSIAYSGTLKSYEAIEDFKKDLEYYLDGKIKGGG